MSIDEFKGIITSILDEKLNYLLSAISEKENKHEVTKEYSRNDLTELFGVTYQTILNWEKEGILIPKIKTSSGGFKRYYYSFENVNSINKPFQN